MTDETPTIEDLQRQIDQLESEMQELMEEVSKVLNMGKAVEHIAQRLATSHKEPLADWWWLS
jgi:prefoldin subunit 5